MRLPEGLPELRGRWLTAYKLLWWAMLAVTLVAVTFGQWRNHQETSRIERQFYGAGLLPDDAGDKLTFSPLSRAARAAGIMPGSLLLAIDGRAVPTDLSARNVEYVARKLEGPDGETLTMRLRSPNGEETDVRVVRGAAHLAAADREAGVTHEQRTLISLAARTLNALTVLAGAILLFWRRASDPVAATRFSPVARVSSTC